MKTETRITKKLEFGSVRMEVSCDNKGIPLHASVSIVGGPLFMADAEDLLRVAAALNKLYLDATYRLPDVCPDHGFYKRPDDSYKCPTCEPPEIQESLDAPA